MRKLIIKLFTVLASFSLLMTGSKVHAQTATDFQTTIRNVSQVSDRILEFDIYLLNNDALNPMEMASYQAGITLNPGIYAGGTLTASIVAGTSTLSNAGQVPTSVTYTASATIIKLAAKTPPGAGSGSIISQTSPGTRIIRLRLTSTTAFVANTTPDFFFAPSTAAPPSYPTKVALYIGTTNTPMAVTMGVNAFVLENPVLNGAPITPFAMTGGGSYCQGGTGLPVGLAGSELGVTYTLYKNSVAQVPTVAGTGSAISFGNQTAGTYTATGTNGLGTTPMTGSAVLTENPAPDNTLTVGGAGSVCSGTGTNITVASSVSGTTYQLRDGTTNIGTPVAGTGGTISLPTGNLTTSTTFNVLATITATNCSAQLTGTATVTVIALANLSSTLTPGSVCSATTFSYTATSATPGATFAWTRATVAGITEPGTSGTGNVSEVLTNTTSAPIALTYMYTTTANGCPNTPQSVVVTVNPTPSLSSSLTPAGICSAATFTYTAASATAGATFAWTRATVAGITEPGTSGTGNVSEVLTNTTTAPISVTYAYVTTANGCSNTAQNVVVVVSPSPVLSSTLSPAAFCSGTTFSYTATSATSGATFAWTRATVAGITEPGTSGTGNVSEVLTNTTTAPISVTYSYVTTANGCSGSAQNVVVAVNPSPVLSSSLTPAAISSGATFSYTATSTTPGATFAWSRATIVGITEPGTSGTGNVNEVLTNTTIVPINVTYAYVTTANGCSSPQNVVVTVNPSATNTFQTTLRNVTQVSDRILEFDLYLLNLDPINPMEMASYQAGVTLNPAIYGAGTLTATIVAGTSTLTNAAQVPTVVTYTASATIVKLAGKSPPGAGSGSIISQVSPGTRIIRLRLTNTVPFTANTTPNFYFAPSTAISPSYPTKVALYIGGINTLVPVSMGVNAFVIDNPVLNQSIPTAFAVTGTGSYCQGGSGLAVGLANSEVGVTYTLYKNSVAQVPTVAGTGAAISFGTMTAGTYTVQGTNAMGTTVMTGSAVITETTPPTATIAYSGSPFCKSVATPQAVTLSGTGAYTGGTYSAAAGLSLDAGTGAITPGTSTAATYTVTYTIPASGGCLAVPVTTSVTINPQPAALAGADRTICAGTSTQIGAAAVAGSTYSWTSSPAGFTSTTANPTVTPSVTTTYTVVETITATGCTNTNSVIVTVNPLPAAAAGANRAICLNASTTIGAAAVAGSTYSWTSSPAGFTSTSANPTVTPLVTTTYTVVETVTASGCTNSNSVVVTVNPLPAAVAGADRAICLNSSTQIGAAAVAGSTYSWTSSPAGFTSTSANPTVTPLVTTTYTVVETITATGCTNTHSVVVTVNPLPAAAAGANRAICAGASTQIGAAAVAGSTYSWTSSPAGFTSTSANPTVTPTVTTTYTVVETITAGGCTNSNSVVVTVNPLPAAAAGANRSICLNTSTTIGAAAVAGSTYSWTSSPAGFTSTTANPTVTPLVTTTYTVVETITATGCTNTNSVVVTVNPLPAAVAGTDRGICYGTSTTLGAAAVAGSSYNWTSSPAGFTSTTANPTVSPLVTTTYTLVETISATGCTNTHSVIVTVNPLPAAAAGSGSTICQNASTAIGAPAVAGSTYSWTSSPAGFTSTQANPTVTPLVTTTYTVVETVTATGCTNSHSVVITVNPLPAAVAGANRTTCAGVATTLGAAAVAGSTYSWTSSPAGFTSTSANPSVSPIVTTTYTVTETITATGCTNSNSVVVTVNPLPLATAGANRAICLNSSTTLGDVAVAGNTYSWTSSPAGFTSTQSNPTVTPLVTTTYTLVETISATGCTNTNSVTVTVNPLPAAIAGTSTAICLGASTTLGAAAVIGNTYSWSSTPAGFTSALANPSVSPLVTTTYTLVETITATGCTNTNSITITVDPVTVGGTVASAQTICQGSTPADLVLSGHTGNVTKWQKASDAAFTTPTDIVSTSSTLTGATIGSLTASSYFRAVVKSGSCAEAFSASVLITVDPTSVGGTIASAQVICGGTAPADLVLSGNTGSVVKWQRSSDAAFTAPTDIAVTSTTLTGATIGILTANTWFRAVVQSGLCTAVNSSSVLVGVSGFVGDWLGVTSSDWFTPSNWCSGIPTSTTNVVIPAGVPNMPSIGSAGAVCRSITIDATASLSLTATGALSIAGDVLNNGTISAASASSITMNGTAAQTYTGSVADNLGSLTINNSLGVTMLSGINVNGTLTLTAGTLSVGGNTLGINGPVSRTSGLIAATTLSSLNFGGSGAITVPSDMFSAAPSINNLTINRSAGVTLGNQNMTVNGTLNLAAGTFSLGANTLTLTGNSPIRTTGNLDAGNASATLVFANAAAMTLPASFFSGPVNNLTLSGAGGVTAGSDITVNGILNLAAANPSATKGLLEMTISYTNYPGSNNTQYLNSYILNMGASATTTGTGDVTGTVKRTMAFAPNTPYSFGHQYSTIQLTSGGTMPSYLSVTTTIGNTPPGKPNAIKRTYEIVAAPDGSGCTLAANFHYQSSELASSIAPFFLNTETQMVTWDYDIGGSGSIIPDEHGRSAYDFTNKFIGMANIPIDYFIQVPVTHDWRTIFTLGDFGTNYFTWDGSVSTLWTLSENWTPEGVPSDLSHVIIPDAATTPNDPILPAGNTSINTISIQAGGVLVMGNNTMTIKNSLSGGWEDLNPTGNDPGTSTVIFSTPGTSISGFPWFYNVEIGNGADVTNQASSYVKISNGITRTGTGKWYADLPGTTVEYSGPAQTIVLPDGTDHYNNLVFSGSGIKTMPGSALILRGNLTLAGSATITAGGTISVGGNLLLGSGTTFTAGSFTHNVGGNFENNGSSFNVAGSTFNFNGITSQSIGGFIPTSFSNLTLNNAAGATLGNIINVTGTLTLTSGVLSLGSNNLNLGFSAVAGTPSASNMIVTDGSGQVRRQYSGNGSYTFPVGDVSGTAEYSPITLNFTSGTYSGAYAGVRVINAKHPNNASATNYLTRYWSVSTGGISNFNCNVSATYVTADIAGTEGSQVAGKYSGALPWVKYSTLAANTLTANGVTSFSDFTGITASPPSVTINTNPSLAVCQNTLLTLTASPVGDPSFTYSWSPGGATTSSITPSTATAGSTLYTVTVTDGNGFTASSNATVVVNPLPAAIAGADRAICLNASTTLGAAAVAGNTYSWTSSPAGFTSTQANPTVSPLVTTTYTVVETVTATGCSNTHSVIVTVNPLPAAVAGADRTICLNASTTLGAAAVAGSTYSWSSSPAGFTSTQANPTVAPLVTTTYTVVETITATGCTNTHSVVVTVNPLPAAVAGADRAICLNASTTLGAAAIAGSTYSWTSSPAGFTSTQANPTVTPLVTTTYTLVETITATGCTNTNSVIVTVNPLPAAVAGANRTICLNASTTLGAAAVAGSTYSWSSSPAGFTSTQANPSVTPLVTTTYTVIETVTATGCSNTNSVTVTVNPLPVAAAGTNRAICSGTSTQIGAAAVAGSTYSWTSSPAGFTSSLANPSVTPLTTTTYTVVETITATGCSNSNSVIVTVNPLPAAAAGANRAICLNESTTLGAPLVAGSTYSWTSTPAGYTSTQANPTITPFATTTYTLVETITATGCTNTNSVVVTVNPLPAAAAGANRAICVNTSTTLGAAAVAGSTYSWTSLPAGFTSTAANPTVSPLVTTTYTVVETYTATGCTNSNSVVVTVNSLPAAVAGADRAICLNASTTLGGAAVAGSTYSWTSSPAGFTSTSANPTVSPVVTTTYTVVETVTATGCTNSNSVVVTVNPLPVAAAGANRAICLNASTTLGAAAVAGSTYSWTSSPAGFTSTSANPTVAPLVTTTYTVVETNSATGCTNSNSVIVTVNPLPAAIAGADRSICLNASTTIGAAAVAGSTYSWTSSPAGFTSTSANPTVSPLVNTTYTVVETVTATGCTNTNSVVVTVNPLPAAAAGADRAICLNTSTTLGAAAVAGSTYSWTSNPAGFTSTSAAPTVTPLVTTTYTVVETTTATGCTNSHSVVVTVNPLPAAIAGANRDICLNSSTTLGAAAVAGSTYSWTSSPAGFTSTAANPTVSPLVTTTYTLVETITATGCTNTNSVTVTVTPLPAAFAGADRAICLNASTTLGGTAVPGSTYSWTSSPAGFTSTAANPTVSPLVNTTYTLVETVTATGCTNSNSVVVTVNPLPAAAAGADRAICLNASTTIGAAAVIGSTYSWTSVPAGFTSTAANPTVSPLVTTTYTVVETSTATGCTNTHSVVVSVNPLPAAAAGADRAICLNASTTIGAAAVAGSTYSWTSTPAGFTSTSANPTVSPLVNTTYTVVETVTATGCTNTNSVVVTINPLPAAAAGADRAICLNASTTLGAAAVAGSTYSWTSSPAGFTSTAAAPTVTPLVTTTYTVVETITATGCTNSNSVVVTVTPLPVADFSASNLTPALNTTVTFTDLTPGIATAWAWSFTPGTVTYMGGTTASSQNPQVQFTAGGLYTVSLTVTVGSCVNTTTKTDYVRAGTPGIWTGLTSTDWHTGTNWQDYLVPTVLMNIVIPPGVPNWPVATGNLSLGGSLSLSAASCNLTVSGNLTLLNGSTVNNLGTVTVQGNLVNQNLLASTLGTGTFNFNGIGTQTISGPNVFGNLTLNNASGFGLGSDQRVNGTLTFTSGQLTLGSSNLTLGTAATVAGTLSSANMVVATGLGEMRKMFSAAGSFTFPVGDNNVTSDYTPATLTFSGGTFAAGAYAGVNLADTKHPSDTNTIAYVKRYWNVSQTGISAFSCNAVFKYVPGDVVGNESLIYCTRLVPTPTQTYEAANTSLHQLTALALTSFGTFGGTITYTPLTLTVFLEGLYAGGGTMNNAYNFDGINFTPKWGPTVADRITVEIHDPVTYATILKVIPDVNLGLNGNALVNIPTLKSGNYYITIKHRNSIETVCATPQAFAGSSLSYNFSNAASKAYGSNLKAMGSGVFAIYVGDVSDFFNSYPGPGVQDGIIDIIDLYYIYPSYLAGDLGYVVSDLNGDGVVDVLDLYMDYDNYLLGIYAITP